MRLTRRGLVTLTVSLPMVGCDASPAAADPWTIRMGVANLPGRLNPIYATDALSSRINRLLYRALTDFDQTLRPVPDLARWQQLDSLSWQFELIDRPQFPDGQRVSAQDVAATYRHLLHPATGSPLRGSLAHIRQVVALSAHRVRFRLQRPDPLFPERLNIGILPARLLAQGHDFDAQPFGCGPCRFAHRDAQQVTLRRPDGVSLQFVRVKDPLVQVLKLRKGELDLVQGGLSPELVNYCAHRPELRVAWHRGTNFAYLGFNFRDAALRQLPVRRAIAHGVDREAIVRAFFHGHAQLAGSLLAPTHWAALSDWRGYEYDPERARMLLHQAGFKRLRLSYKTSANPLRLRLAAVYQDMLQDCGIDLEIQSFDWGTFYGDIKQGRFQLYSLAWVGVKSPDIFQYVFHSSMTPPAGANRGRYRDAQVDRLIEAALQAPTEAQQRKLYHALQRRLAETVAVVPLWYEDQYAVMRQGLQGYRLYADGRYDGLLSATKGSP